MHAEIQCCKPYASPCDSLSGQASNQSPKASLIQYALRIKGYLSQSVDLEEGPIIVSASLAGDPPLRMLDLTLLELDLPSNLEIPKFTK